MTIKTKGLAFLNMLNSRAVGYIWCILSILTVGIGVNDTMMIGGGLSLVGCMVMYTIMSGSISPITYNYRLGGREQHGGVRSDDQPVAAGIALGFLVSITYYIVVYVVLHHVLGLFSSTLTGYVLMSTLVGIGTYLFNKKK